MYQLCFKIRLATVEFKFKFVYSHLFNYNTTTIRKKKRRIKLKKKELTIHRIKHNKGKECVAANGAKLSSWLLPQSGYKWVEVIQLLLLIIKLFRLNN